MSINKGLFSSKTDLWSTPQDFFDKLNEEFKFETDVCALPENAKCKKYFTPDIDGLKQEWRGTCWMNPPYGREIGKWVQKAYESSLQGATVVCLLPSRTDTKWWHDYCMKGEIRFVRGRLKFGNASENAPFPSAVVVFRPGVPETNCVICGKREGKYLSTANRWFCEPCTDALPPVNANVEKMREGDGNE